MTALLEVRNLTKRFGGLTAVNNVSFTLNKGEILGFIGPNGAGKTTVVGLISGSIYPSSGEVYFKGARIDTVPMYRCAHMGIGRTFQIMKPFPGLSVLDNVAVGAMFGRKEAHHGLTAAREQARANLDFVGLGNAIDKRAEELGGPDRKRLELAKALAMQPELLLCDEVMAGLNLVEIEEVIEVVRKVRDLGVTILVIEHVMKAIKSLSDRLMVLHHGEKIAEGSTDAVLSNPVVIEAYLGKKRA